MLGCNDLSLGGHGQNNLPTLLAQIVVRAFAPAVGGTNRSCTLKRAHAIAATHESSTLANSMVPYRDDVRPDESLLRAHLEGDASAFPTLVERYRNELHGFLARFLGSSAAADDVFQDTFLQVHLSAATFDQERNFKPWLFTVAANKARDFHRKHKRRKVASLDANIGADSDGPKLGDMLEGNQERPDARSEAGDQQALVKRVIDGLPSHHREVILLGYFRRMSYQQVADALQVPLGTIKSRMHAAVALFSARWRKAAEKNDL